MLLKILFIALAAICKAMVDTIAFHKGGRFLSDFFNINKQGSFLPFTKYPFDGFHIFNSFMILFFILASCVYPRYNVFINVALYSALSSFLYLIPSSIKFSNEKNILLPAASRWHLVCSARFYCILVRRHFPAIHWRLWCRHL